ncbi:PTS sugar transporter subunit IIA [Thermoanaerobacterium thermosaccharolyticum]|uniref:PTS sugar transporter subunit IIA n=1 Tax=Thermoanaerobacterium thermosaccharolyticum TaxID=1517 RepID=UPI00123991C2|nr:PTS fructose transporter subunit IIA [Thermoanaerobacterium thermosaccharolyticum]KAA5806022.1 PTS fructose transporter subunit IIA [Thermoanaerobacterium thermosaccharolyticum]
MRKILIATHGYLANGVKSSIEILCGVKNNISYINAYVNDNNIEEEIDLFFKNLKPNDEAVIFTDLFGGSVNQRLVPYCSKPNVYIISGFNLAIILEIVLKDGSLSEEEITKLVEHSRKQLVYIKKEDLSKRKNEEFF